MFRSAKIKKGFSALPLPQQESSQRQCDRRAKAEARRGQGRASREWETHQEEEVDCVREVSVEAICPECHCVMKEKDYRERSVLDIDPIRVLKVLYRLQRRQCPQCKQFRTAQAAEVLPRSMFSNRLIAEIVDSHYMQGMPQFFKDRSDPVLRLKVLSKTDLNEWLRQSVDARCRVRQLRRSFTWRIASFNPEANLTTKHLFDKNPPITA